MTEISGVAKHGAPRRTTAALVGVGALWLSAAPMAYLQFAAAGRLDTVRATVSDYVSVPGGAALLALSAVSLAAACVALAVALAGVGLRRPGAVYAVLGVAAAGLLASALCPTNEPGTVAGPTALVHRYAAGLFFLALPVAGWLVRRRLPRTGPAARSVGWGTLASVIVGAGFLASHVPLLWPGFPGSPAIAAGLPRGLAERGLLVVDLLLLGALARARP